MLEDAAGIRRVVIACGYVDLRKGIDGLSMIIGDRLMLSRLVDTFFSKTSWTMLLYAENHSISVA